MPIGFGRRAVPKLVAPLPQWIQEYSLKGMIVGAVTASGTFSQRYERLGDAPGAISELLQSAAEDAPDRPFIGVGHDRLTFKEADASASSLASGLAEVGVAPGDHVAYLSDTSLAMIELLFAVWRLGSVNVPLNAFLRGQPLVHQIVDSDASVVVVDEQGFGILEPLLGALPKVRTVILVGAGTNHDRDDPRVIPLDSLRTGGSDPFDSVALPVTAPAAFVYTSGTTGLPKACVLSHRYFHHLGKQCSAGFDINGADSLYSVSPLYHLGAFIPLMAALQHRIPIVFDQGFSASQFLNRVRELDATLLLGVGFYAFSLLKQPAGPGDKDHRMRAMLLAPLSEPDRVEFEARFGISLITQLYGQTEVSMATFNPTDGPQVPGTVGAASPWVTMQIVDELDRPLPANTVGEIVFRPNFPGVMFDGYWNRPGATVKASTNLWHHSGDLGRIDEDGFLTFVGRKSDSIRRRGENVSAFEVEQVIIGHPKVADVAVHAVHLPDETEDLIKVCLVVQPGEVITAEEMAEYFLGELAYFAVPRFVELLEQLPRNASGRVVKAELAQRTSGPDLWDLEELELLSRRRRRA
jgi:crotonobetaine/carnitine-CoA ligase